MDTKELNGRVGKAVAQVLREQGKPLSWLARESGVPYPTLKRVTLGQARITAEVVGSIAHALNVPVTRLLPDSMSGKSRLGK